jgi:hypothetical protein
MIRSNSAIGISSAATSSSTIPALFTRSTGRSSSA